MFKQRGVIVIAADAVDEDKIMELALEAGAEDIDSDATCHEIMCTPESYLEVKGAIEAANIDIASAEVSMVAENTVAVDLEAAKKIVRLMDALEDHDDSQNVSSNVDIPDDIFAQLNAD